MYTNLEPADSVDLGSVDSRLTRELFSPDLQRWKTSLASVVLPDRRHSMMSEVSLATLETGDSTRNVRRFSYWN